MPRHIQESPRDLTYFECQAIAQKLNGVLLGMTSEQRITTEHVYNVSTGADRMPSHPVWQRINAEIARLRAGPEKPKKGKPKTRKAK